MYTCRAPKDKVELAAYYQLRWQILRQPWQQPQGSEKDELESQSYHRVIVDDMDNILGVGRLHQSAQHRAQVRISGAESYFLMERSTPGQVARCIRSGDNR